MGGIEVIGILVGVTHSTNCKQLLLLKKKKKVNTLKYILHKKITIYSIPKPFPPCNLSDFKVDYMHMLKWYMVIMTKVCWISYEKINIKVTWKSLYLWLTWQRAEGHSLPELFSIWPKV